MAYSAYFSYYIILAFFPFLLIVITAISYIDIINVNAINFIKDWFPDNTYNYVNDIISEIVNSDRKNLISVSVIFMIWSSSRGLKALMIIINKSYNQKETRSFLKVELYVLSVTLLMIFLIVLYVLIVIFGNLIAENFLRYVNLYELYNNFHVILDLVVPFIITILVGIYIYYIIPNKKLKLIDTLPGSIILSIGLLIISKLFSLYINNYSNYGKIYGSVTGIIIFLIWLNFVGLIIMIGAEVNAIIYKNRIKKKIRFIGF